MTVFLSPVGGAGAQFFDNNGNPLSGGKLYTYSAGTTAPLACYTSVSGDTAHSNPIVLNSAGRVSTGEIWIEYGYSYKFALYTSNDVLIATYDNINEIPAGFVVVSNHTGNGITTTFSIGSTPDTKLATDVHINGVYQGKNTYSISGSDIIFTTAPPINSDIEIVTQQTNVLGVTSADAIGYTLNAVGAVTQTVGDKLDYFVFAEDFGAVSDGTATSGTDNSAAFAAAFAASDYVTVANRSGRYWLKNVDIPSGKTLDLRGAIVQPAAGADYCFKISERAQLRNGEFRDSPNNSLKSITLTASAIAGDTTVTVDDPSIFYEGGLIVVVSDDDSGFTPSYGGPKLAVNHATVANIAGSVITLSEPLQFDASSGNAALTSLGCVVVEGSNAVIQNLYITTVPLGVTVRSPVSGGGIGKIRITDIEMNTARLGGIIELGSVSSATYDNIRGYLAAAGAPYVAAFGHKTDGSQAAGTKGGHHLTRCDYLGTQEAFDFQDTEYVSLTDCYADTVSGVGVRVGQGTNDVLVTAQWASFCGKALSVSGAATRVYFYSCYTLASAPTVPWGQNIALEVEDGCTDIYINRDNWRRSRAMRADPGWDTINNVTYMAVQHLAEDGTASAPARSWKLDTDTGWYRFQPGEERFQSNGNTRFRVNIQGAGLQDGSALEPALFFAGNPDTGAYYDPSGQIRMTVNGLERWFWGDNDSGPITAPLRLPDVTLATANALTGLTDGQMIYITNGRKVGEGEGAGTGVMAYYSASSWRVFSTDAAVTT